MWYNLMMAWLLRSPLHGLLGESFMLISVRGRKSGRIIRTPVNYVREGNTLWVTSQRNRTWWRNLRGGAPVNVFVQGQELKGHGDAIVDQPSVASGLATFLRLKPQYAKYYHIGLDQMGQPAPADCERAALERVAIRIDLQL